MTAERGRSPTTAVLATVYGTAALALVAFVAAVALDPARWSGRTALLAALLCALLVAARAFPLHVAPKTKVTVGTAPLFAAVLLLPAPLAMLVGAAGATLAWLVRRAPWFQALHATAECALRAGVGVAVFALLSDQRPLDSLAPGRWIAAVALAAVAMELVNAVVVDAVVSVQLRTRPLAAAWPRLRQNVAQEVALYATGLFLAVVGGRYPWTMPLLAMPAWVVHRSLRDSVALRAQTRRSLEELADAVDRRDPHAAGHARRTAALARATAQALRLSPEEQETVELAARLHDIGKLGIDAATLAKAGPLSAAEWRAVNRHAETGAEMLASFPELGRARELVLAHHEWFDGTGYPRGLAGERIPLGARVIAVADAWDAMMSGRAHRWSLPPAQALTELERGRGTQFDPAVVDAFRGVLEAHPELAAPPRDGEPAGHAPRLRMPRPEEAPGGA